MNVCWIVFAFINVCATMWCCTKFESCIDGAYNHAMLQFAMMKNQLVLIRVFFFLFLLHSVQGGIYALGKAHNYAPHPVSQKFPQRCLWNSSSARLTMHGHWHITVCEKNKSQFRPADKLDIRQMMRSGTLVVVEIPPLIGAWQLQAPVYGSFPSTTAMTALRHLSFNHRYDRFTASFLQLLLWPLYGIFF